MDITIRLEQPADYREAETVTREAFWNCYSPGCMEHYLLHVMRRSPRFVRELDFVAVADGKIVGSVVFMKAMIMGDDGNRHEVLTLGPIAVLPAFQRKGIGRMLKISASARPTTSIWQPCKCVRSTTMPCRDWQGAILKMKPMR